MPRSRLRAAREYFSIATQTDPNAYGNGYGLTALLPIVAGREDDLEAHLATLDPLASPFGRVPQAHFTRLLVIRDLVYQGPPQIPESLDSSYLIFTSSFDGKLDRYLQDVARLVGDDAAEVFAHTVGFPGLADTGAFAAWITKHKRDNGYVLTPWPFASVGDVKEGLRVQKGFGELVEGAREMDDAELQAAFGRLMAGGR
jgi:hypothetical protein